MIDAFSFSVYRSYAIAGWILVKFKNCAQPKEHIDRYESFTEIEELTKRCSDLFDEGYNRKWTTKLVPKSVYDQITFSRIMTL